MKWKKGIFGILFCFGILTGCADVVIEEDSEGVVIEDANIDDVNIDDVNTRKINIDGTDIDIIDIDDDNIETVEVVKVVDGDTIKVDLEGEKYTIRMIGIDTPESVHPDESKNTIYGQKASDYAKGIFSEGQTVYLSRDVSDRDKYDRLLRYVWLEKPNNVNDETEIREKMYNAKVLLDGYANTYEYAPDNTLFGLFLAFESEAAEQKRGLWAENGLNTENIDRAAAQIESEEDIFIGNKNSKKLHSSYCTDLPQEKNRVYFDSKEEAIEQGYEIDTKCIK